MKDLGFSEHEQTGREKFKKNISKGFKYEFTEDPYAKWDVSTTGRGHTYNVEIKDRDILFTKYLAEGYMLEKIKYDALMEAYEQTGSIPIYLNYFQEGVGFTWNLTKVNPVWRKAWCTETTADGTYGQKKVLKTVTYLFPKDGTRFNYE